MPLPVSKNTAFKITWSSEIAYSVGIIVTDGTLSPDGSHIELVCKDREQIEHVKDFLSVNAKIIARDSGKFGKGKSRYCLRWEDDALYEFLFGIGFRPYKTLTLGSLKVPDKYFFDFLRGCQDGDACFSSYFDPYWKENNFFYLVFSSKSFEYVLWLQETIERLSGARGTVLRSGNSVRISNVKYAKQEVVVILSRMHQSASLIPPSRKRLKITRALAIVGVSLEMS